MHDAFTLESLVGHLVHATKVCPLGKAFLSGLFQVLRGMQHSRGQPRRLNLATRADIAWWHFLLAIWQGVSVQQCLALGQPNRHLFSDASGSWGCGAWSLPHWFQFSWPHGHGLSSIALIELVPIVLAAAAWGTTWRGLFVLCHSDNSAVVSQINSLHAQDPLACNILRCLAFFQAHFDLWLRAVHVAGKENVGTDLLSRNRAAAFLARFPHASPLPSQVHQGLVQLLCLEPAEWTSLCW